MLDHAMLYFIPRKGDSGSKPGMTCGGEFLKIQPGTGDNLTRDDIADGYTGYVIWNRLAPESLDIDGELPMECLDSGIVLLKGDPGSVPGMTTKVEPGMTTKVEPGMTFEVEAGMTLKDILEQAYGDSTIKASLLLG
ncbi:MAG: hypothetical protein MJY93_06330 [Fibrobacter sp.]|nr:hypothetical protein [Fibrobacter sp.]